VKQMFLSKKTTRHMRWHKEGVCENNKVMVHPFNGEAWKLLDTIDIDFAMDAKNKDEMV
jgi:hypothetical protein